MGGALAAVGSAVLGKSAAGSALATAMNKTGSTATNTVGQTAASESGKGDGLSNIMSAVLGKNSMSGLMGQPPEDSKVAQNQQGSGIDLGVLGGLANELMKKNIFKNPADKYRTPGQNIGE